MCMCSILFYSSRSTNRRDTVNTVLPVLAYLLSDVIVFVDTVEPRRLQVRATPGSVFDVDTSRGAEAVSCNSVLVFFLLYLSLRWPLHPSFRCCSENANCVAAVRVHVFLSNCRPSSSGCKTLRRRRGRVAKRAAGCRRWSWCRTSGTTPRRTPQLTSPTSSAPTSTGTKPWGRFSLR